MCIAVAVHIGIVLCCIYNSALLTVIFLPPSSLFSPLYFLQVLCTDFPTPHSYLAFYAYAYIEIPGAAGEYGKLRLCHACCDRKKPQL